MKRHALSFHFLLIFVTLVFLTNAFELQHWKGRRTGRGASSCSRFLALTANNDNHNEEADARRSWLVKRLDISPKQASSMVERHPPLIDIKITKLEPTIAFYEEALSSREAASTLMVESPSLLEYNARKRLQPRLAMVLDSSLSLPLNGTSIRAIATKTDTRFDQWLTEELKGGKSTDEKEVLEDNSASIYKPYSYVVLSNLQSGSNIGNILRSASIFGCHECLVVGQKRYRLTGEHGARHQLTRRHFYTHQEAKMFLESKQIRVYGVEIMENAAPLMKYNPQTKTVAFPFDDTLQQNLEGAAFVLGNEGEGLSLRQREICDQFLFIPQTRGGTERTGGTGSASLNVACAATVVLQAYSTWAGYPHAKVEGEKFRS